jgi:hypothetical protein
MADYYPLISRAVAGLEKNTGENRRALYERARGALLAQLRGVTPALSESDITRERLALEESIRKVEAEAARQFVEPTRQPPAPKIRPAEQRSAETRSAEARPSESRSSELRSSESRYSEPRASESRLAESRLAESRLAESRLAESRASEARTSESRVPEPRVEARQWREVEQPSPRRYVNPPPAQQESRAETMRKPRVAPTPSALPDPRQSGSIFDAPLPSAEPAPAPPPPSPRHPLRRPVGERRAPAVDGGLKDSGLRDFRNVISEANELGSASARAERSAREAFNAVPAPTDLDRPTRSYDRSDRSDPRTLEEPEAYDREPDQRMDDEARPHGDFSEPMLESSFAIDDTRPVVPRGRRAVTADEEDDFEPAPRSVRPPRSYRGLVKPLVAAVILIALFGALAWQWSNLVGIYRSFRTPTEVAREATTPASPKKAQERIEPGAQQTAALPTPGAAQAAVAQKVVLYEEDPDNPNGKRFVGSAVWRTETVTPGPGMPPELAVRADIEVPERKLTMSWSFRRNTDKGLPATHTVEIMFKLPSDFPAGGISNVPGILMKQAESTRGVPLAGLAVKVTPGFYLIGLSNSDPDKDRNMQLLKERGWFDIPVVYNNNRRAILAMEKGTPGDRAFADAFKAWKQ